MSHPLVTQLRFARSEFMRVMDGVPAEDAVRRLEPMNCLSWIVGHLANQEQFYWLFLAQGPQAIVDPQLYLLVGSGQPPTTPPMADMLATWQAITAASDSYLDTLTDDVMLTHLVGENGQPLRESIGTNLQRVLYHYWFHTGEAHAIRQQLGHRPPDFVGNMAQALFRVE